MSRKNIQLDFGKDHERGKATQALLKELKEITSAKTYSHVVEAALSEYKKSLEKRWGIKL